MAEAYGDDLHPADRPDAGARTARGGALRVSGYAAGTLLSLAGMVFVTRALGPADFGRFQTVLNIVLIIGIVSDVGLATLGVREYSTAAASQRSLLLRALLGLRIALTVVGVIIGVAIVGLVGASPAVVLGMVAAGLGLVLTVIQSTFIIPLQTALRFVAISALDVARQALMALGYIAAALAGVGLLGFYAVVIPVACIILAATVALTRRSISLVPAFDAAMWRRLAFAGLSFALASTVGIIYQYTAQILTVVVSTDVEAGLFATALRVYVVVSAVPGLVVAGALPILSRSAQDDAARFRYAMRLLTDTTLAVGALLAVGLVVGAPLVIAAVGGPEYADAVTATRVLGPALVVASAIATWGFGLLALHRHLDIALANAVVLVSSIALSLPLARAYGATGAAIATLGVETLLAVGYGAFLMRTRQVQFLRARTLVGVLVAFVVGSGAALLPGLPVIVATVVGMVVCAGVIAAFRVLPREVLDVVPPSVRRYVAWGTR